MNDLAFLAIFVALFAVAVLFVGACDRLIGRGEDVAEGASAASQVDRQAAA